MKAPSPEERLILPAKRFELMKPCERDVKKSRALDRSPDPDQRLGGVDIDERRLADRHLGDRLAVAGDQMAGADVALDRHQVVEEAARPQYRIAAAAFDRRHHRQRALLRIER